MAMKTCPSASPTSWTVAMLLCVTAAAARASRRKRSLRSGLDATDSGSTFRATCRRSVSSVAR